MKLIDEENNAIQQTRRVGTPEQIMVLAWLVDCKYYEFIKNWSVRHRTNA